MEPAETSSRQALLDRIQAVDWYHTVDLGDGIITEGHYDHRPYLPHYGLPDDLAGARVLDIGAASGFFSFELEKRGGSVTATDLASWDDHDFGANYQGPSQPGEEESYLHQPIEIAIEALDSSVGKKNINIYDISPETMGTYDLVFCGSLLIHLSDPVKALKSIASVTDGMAIIATVILESDDTSPIAETVGYRHGDSWWVPSRRTLELITACAGFAGIRWISDFRLDYRDGTAGPYHGVLHAYKDETGWPDGTRSAAELIEAQKGVTWSTPHELGDRIDELTQENQALRNEVEAYRQRRFIRLTNWARQRLGLD